MKSMKRLLAMLLCVVMVVGLIPASILTVGAAEGETIYVLAGSDFQASSHDAGATIVSGLLEKVREDYPTMNGFLFAGDYDVNYADSANGKAKLQETVQSVYGTEMHEIYVQGNHDGDNLVGSTLTASGANDAEDYGVFVINEKDYMWYNDDEATIKNTATNLENYLNAKRNAGYTKPIFVISHLPLHYSMRTRSGGKDGMHANYIFDVLNEAGNAGLNIIFMFGHNHSHGWDDYLGGAAIFLTNGDKINIAQNSTTDFQEETLAFTYMNAGYVGYYGTSYTSDVDKTLTMTTFEITDTNVKISRYDANGTHDLKSAGVYNVEYPDSAYYSTDTTTVGTPYTLPLNTEITPADEEVEAPGSGTTTTERTYTRVTSTSELVSGGQYLIIENGSTDYFMLPEVTSNSAGDRVGYAIESTSVAGGDTITGDYSAKEWTMTGSGTSWVLSTDAGSAYMEYQSSSRAYGRISSTNSSTFTIGGSANAFTFATTTNGYEYVFDHGSNDLINGYVKTPEDTFYIYRLTSAGSGGSVDTDGGDWITITEPTQAGTRYVYELDTNGVDTGVEYLIVANSYSKALSAAASSNNAVDIEISGNYAYASSDTYGWTFTRYSNGVYYIRLNGSTYLRVSNGALGSRNNTNSDARWTVTNNNDGSYDIVRSSYDLRWSNSNGVFQASSSNEGPVRLYKYVKTETTTAQEGLYGKISGELTYNVDRGTSAEDALAAVKAGITVYYTNDKSATTGTVYGDDADGMTWTLDPSYDGTTPGEYSVTIAYNGKTLGVAKVVVPSVNIESTTVEPASATVRQGASQSLVTGSKIIVTLEDGTYYTVPVTISMLSKDGAAVSTAEVGTQTGLTVTYNGMVITHEYTLRVVEKTQNNDPEYPDEGAVKVNKTATGIQFQSSGVAQVELSASGVPAQKGADVVIVIDTSSSMRDNDVGSTGKSRIQVLSESLEQMLKQFQTPGDSGITPDIDVAIIDFNGYYPSSAGDFDKISLTNSYRTNVDYAQIFTGTNASKYIKNVGLSATDFVEIDTINATTIAGYFTDSNCQSGTNYDGALENAYTLLSAKQAANGEEDRDSYVIFLSDGAPFRYNGYNNGNTKSTYNTWNNYLSGYWSNADALSDAYPTNAYTYFYNGNGTNHPHLYAEAIKGVKGELYQVISRDAATNTPAYMKQVSGLGAVIYSIGFGLADDGSDSEGGKVSVATQQELIQVISSGSGYNYPNVQSKYELVSAFTQIATAINYAATNARFVDQMGASFNLQMTPIVDMHGDAITDADGNAMLPSIEVLSYDIWTRQDYLDGKVAEDQIGVRKGTYTVLETVTFSADGKSAYSNKIENGTKNILINGVICAEYFWYNTNVTEVAVDGVAIPSATGNTNKLPSETFYWKMGTVQTSELAMRYYVYLAGSLEGTREAGSYATNEYAILYYENYLGNDWRKDTVSPTIAWKSANVSYAFYLVNEDGEIIVNQTTGETGTFANKIAITNPVVYQEILLNNTDQVEALKVAALGENVLPTYYTIYDAAAVYTISIYSDGTGAWKITKGDGLVASTYVTQYKTDNASAYSNVLTNETAGDDYTHTVVWFAVVWQVQAHPDAVVVDYGLPVDISVLTNDMFGENGKLVGIGAYSDSLKLDGHDTALASGFGSDYKGTYGSAKADTTTGKVRYTLDTMCMDGYDQFAYAVNYTGTTNPGYYYDTVTVIPATTIYYEDSFLTYSGTASWSVEGTTLSGVTQDEDRPGRYSLTDANNIYGYDAANLHVSEYSLGSAAKATVDANSYAQATFTFTGTGFDIVSMTSSNTGVLIAQVYAGTQATGTPVTYKTVDTYYGVAYQQLKDAAGNPKVDENGNAVMGWAPVDEIAEGTPNQIYQVPVLKFEGLTYGTYTVMLTASYYDALNHKKDGSYDLYIDAIRIYDPANDGTSDGTEDTTIEDAYIVDGEGWPSYIELRNKILSAGSFDKIANDVLTTDMEGLVFIDGNASVGNANIEDYKSYGPNNEIYLAPGQRVAFQLSCPANVANVHIGLSSADGKAASYTFTNIASADIEGTNVKAGDYYHYETSTVATTTDMYYDLTAWKNDIIVISNYVTDTATNGVLAITNIKVTYTSNPNAAVATSEEPVVFMSRRSAALVLRSLNTAEQTPEVETPEVEVPEVTEPVVPEVTEPTTTAPTVPEVEVPVTTAPVAPSEPETTEPAVPEQNAPAVEVPEAETPKEDVPAVEHHGPNNAPVEDTLQQLGFWARLWNAIKNAFELIFSWFGF